jgi:glycosyltransferase involved in cell wall biosynthesis
LTLARAFARRGHRVDLVVVRPRGPLRGQVPDDVNLVDLSTWGAPVRFARISRPVGTVFAIPALGRYLRGVQPDVLLATANHVHLAALFAHRLSRTEIPLVLRVSNRISRPVTSRFRWMRGVSVRLARRFFPRARALIAVSESVAADLVETLGLPRERIATIYNPTVTPGLLRRVQEPLDHPWLAAGEPPVVLGVGRFVAQKDFPTLIRAFVRVRAKRPARLILLGTSKRSRRRRHLEREISELGVGADVSLPGFVDNPLPYMARAGVFVLSSVWEGLPGALIEAMACGCPVISTDCPGGSLEILEDGIHGPLVPVGDDAAMADAILSVLESPPDRERLRARAEVFSEDAAVDRYLEVLLSTCPRTYPDPSPAPDAIRAHP